ncbi:hypothetical protein ABZ078_24025 [Streptomyces sp. NPDC006385]
MRATGRPDAEERHRLATSAAARQQRAQAEEAIRRWATGAV